MEHEAASILFCIVNLVFKLRPYSLLGLTPLLHGLRKLRQLRHMLYMRKLPDWKAAKVLGKW